MKNTTKQPVQKQPEAEQKLLHLPDAELAVMQALWALEHPAARPELDPLLAYRHWGATTILNLLARLEEKGFVSRQRQGRGYLYRAEISRERYLEAESGQVLQRAFGGSAKQFIAALYQSKKLSAQDLVELEAYLHQLQKEE
jgi:predicted transcriptional regulator